MSPQNSEICEQVLVALRKIVRAMAIHSRQLQREYALTGPQLVLLREIAKEDGTAIGTLARRVSLSNATVTGIVDRLEHRELVVRLRNGKDRRQVLVSSTAAGRSLCDQAPPLLQEQFISGLAGLHPREQAQTLAVVSRLAAMMEGPSTPALEIGEVSFAPDSDGFIAACQMLLDQPDAEKERPRAHPPLELCEVDGDEAFPAGLSRAGLAQFLNTHLHPYQDTVDDILAGLAYALSRDPGKGGLIVLALAEDELAGALIILNTGMTGYIPEHVLLFVAVHETMRGRGLGAQLIQRAQQRCAGDIKLHVEYDNPARRLYERMGFTSKYAEMRWTNESPSR